MQCTKCVDWHRNCFSSSLSFTAQSINHDLSPCLCTEAAHVFDLSCEAPGAVMFAVKDAVEWGATSAAGQAPTDSLGEASPQIAFSTLSMTSATAVASLQDPAFDAVSAMVQNHMCHKNMSNPDPPPPLAPACKDFLERCKRRWERSKWLGHPFYSLPSPS